MAEGNQTQVIGNELVDAVKNNIPVDNKNLSLEQLVVLINTDRVRSLEAKSKSELTELKERYSQVRSLNDLRKRVNNALSAGPKSSLDLTKDSEAKALMEKAKAVGVPVIDGKDVYTKEEAERLLDNIKMTIEDMNVQNDLQMQQISRLQNEHHESFQLAMSIMRPLHQSKTSSARAIAGGR
jgi:hypothetical protein